jgi:hypothetical protein
MTHSHLAPIEVDEMINTDEADRHSSAACGAMLPARRLVITHEHLRGPTAARLAWRQCRRGETNQAINACLEAPHCGPSGRYLKRITCVRGSAVVESIAVACRAYCVTLIWFWPMLICKGVSRRMTRASDSIDLSSCRFVCSQRLL